MNIRITSDWYQPVVNGVVASIMSLTDSLRPMGYEIRLLTLSSTLCSFRRDEVYFPGSIGVGLIYPQARLLAGSGPRRRKPEAAAAVPALAGHVSLAAAEGSAA